MEKLIYPLWRTAQQNCDQLRDGLLGATEGWCRDSNIRGLRLTVADSDVAVASDKRMAFSDVLPDAVLSAWVNDAAGRGALESLLKPLVARFDCYLVTESEPLVNTLHPLEVAGRVQGMCQVVFLQRPERLDEEQWLQIWQESHGQIAIDTQSTFGYRQNVIQRSLSDGAPLRHAMIEENFPSRAMTSSHVFFAVREGDDAALAANQATMMESCARFIDFDKIDVIPMSEYLLKPLV